MLPSGVRPLFSHAMSDFNQLCEILGLELTPMQKICCEGLESSGLRFCVDFGYENAVEKYTRMSQLRCIPEDLKFLAACGVKFD